MKILTFVFALVPALTCFASDGHSEVHDKIHILLIGDSTTEGSIPRLTDPEGPHLERAIRQLLELEPGMPRLKVYNLGQGGDTAFRLLDSGRYEREVAPIRQADFVFVRYGINDWVKRQPVAENFPADFRAVIQRLKMDYPDARIIPMTIIPYLSAEASAVMNKMILEVSSEEDLEVFDIFTPYAKQLENGPNMLNYRRFPLQDIPAKYREWVAPRVHGDRVVVMDNELDALFGDLPGWFNDRHPNLAGYHVIAVETVQYLRPLLRQRIDGVKE